MKGKYIINYLSFIAETANQPETIEDLALKYFEANDYSVQTDWCRAHAICQLGYQIGAKEQILKDLYVQLYQDSWLLHSAMYLDDADYAEWFETAKELNDLFIKDGFFEAYSQQYELLTTARVGYCDFEAAKDYLRQGLLINNPACMALSGFELYSGLNGSDRNPEKALELLEEAKEKGFKDAELYLANIAYSAIETAEQATLFFKQFEHLLFEEHKGLYMVADYYLKIDDLGNALKYLNLGVANGSKHCLYLRGLHTVNGHFSPFDLSLEQGKADLEEAFDYGVLYAGFALGYVALYPKSAIAPDIDLAISYFKRAAQYDLAEANYELGLISIYRENYQDIDAAMLYLERAMAKNFTRAFSEKANLFLEHPEVVKDVAKGKELLQHALELGDDFAPFRLGLGYQNGEFLDEPDYQKALDFFELALSRDHSQALELAARYHKYGYAGDPQPEKTVAYYQRAIDQFDSNYSRVELAICLEQGFGVAQDYLAAETLLQQALNKDYPYAALRLGYLYEEGVFGEPDYDQAFEFFKIAADVEIPEAIYQLARCYRYGIGCAEDGKTAIQLFKKALEFGYLDADVDLALAYEDGYGGLEESLEKAFEHLTKAAQNEIAYAQYKLGGYYAYGFLGTVDWEEGKKWFEKSVANGSPLAALALGDYYLYDLNGENNYDEAIKYYTIAEEKGFVSEGIGVCYQFGVGVENDDQKAFQYYTLAADRGYDAGVFRLGLSYYFGNGTAQDRIEAFYYLKQVADRGNNDAATYVGLMLLKGDGAEKNAEEAIEYLKQAAAANFEVAQYELANCYLKGEGVAENEDLALEWYQKAAENGSEEAQKIVGTPRKRRK